MAVMVVTDACSASNCSSTNQRSSKSDKLYYYSANSCLNATTDTSLTGSGASSSSAFASIRV